MIQNKSFKEKEKKVSLLTLHTFSFLVRTSITKRGFFFRVCFENASVGNWGQGLHLLQFKYSNAHSLNWDFSVFPNYVCEIFELTNKGGLNKKVQFLKIISTESFFIMNSNWRIQREFLNNFKSLIYQVFQSQNAITAF